MTEDEFAAELERDQAAREEELRFLQNLTIKLEPEDDADKYRRSLVLMLYAHFEGSVKLSLQTYVRFLNELGIKVGDANAAIAAAGVSDVMHALRDPVRKCREFQRALPDDSSLHRFARDREFVEVWPEVFDRQLVISDKIVDTDSNLKPLVLRKLLYQLGLDHEMFSGHEPTINKLLEYRNKISHGESLHGISEEAYGRLRTAVLHVMTEIKASLRLCLHERMYIKRAAA